MKKVITTILLGLSIFGFVYLIGCFVNASFDINKWSDLGRALVAVFGGFFSAATMLVYNGEL